ncbi:MAG TPA: YiiD C-terminal domain-containing protein [bacterium]|jgi:thioesterase domain-containing protein|nr:YiiD C-terminal domain-containing protein [bacterium]
MEQELQAALEKHIPLTLALGLEVAEASPRLVRLSFPLGPNRNHQHTAFGGSLYAAVVLAGWGLLWCALNSEGADADVIIAASRERFVKPVGAAFSAECRAPQDALAGALRTLRRRGMARVDLESGILCGGEACTLFYGTYGLLGRGAAPKNPA